MNEPSFDKDTTKSGKPRCVYSCECCKKSPLRVLVFTDLLVKSKRGKNRDLNELRVIKIKYIGLAWFPGVIGCSR